MFRVPSSESVNQLSGLQSCWLAHQRRGILANVRASSRHRRAIDDSVCTACAAAARASHATTFCAPPLALPSSLSLALCAEASCSTSLITSAAPRPQAPVSADFLVTSVPLHSATRWPMADVPLCKGYAAAC
eukprot:2450590-Prymnesium_polylepis.1